MSSTALRFQAGSVPFQQLTQGLEDVLTTLRSIEKDSQKESFDPRLAEYTFFPLSHVFKSHAKAPLRALEIALQALQVLLTLGWQDQLGPDLGIQLLILLTFLAERTNKTENTRGENEGEDLRRNSFTCMSIVIRNLTKTSQGMSKLLDASNIPTVGHAISTILDAVVKGAVGLEAVTALQAFVMGVQDREVLASFLPGVLSTLTKALTPSTNTIRSSKFLHIGLDLVSRLLEFVSADKFAILPASKDPALSKEKLPKPRLDESWLGATASQVKLALANIIKLQNHNSFEVRQALQELCLVVLQTCPKSLNESKILMLETLIALSQHQDTDSATLAIQQILDIDQDLSDQLRSKLYGELSSLPRKILSNDEGLKQRIFGQIETSFTVLQETNAETSELIQNASSALQDSLVEILRHSSDRSLEESHTSLDLQSSVSQSLELQRGRSLEFPNSLSKGTKADEDLSLITSLINALSTIPQALTLARIHLDIYRTTTGETRLSSLYLTLTILNHRQRSSHLLTDSLTSPAEIALLEDLYTITLTHLLHAQESTEIVDPRLLSLSLQSLTLYAHSLGASFRPELTECLYPILHLLASPSPALQQAAACTLNNLALACQYTSAQDLVMSNVDYLINGIGIRLNAFDVSPQAPRVLMMLCKLVGPKVLVYLGDLAESVFEALEAFHGYPGLVGLLFQVLGTVIEEGVRAKAVTGGEKRKTFGDRTWTKPMVMEDVTKQFRERAEKHRARQRGNDALPEKTAHQPWSELKNEDSPNQADPDPSEPPKDPQPSQTYLLLHRITELTQHHLPNPSPQVRHLLLTLLRTSLPYLSQYEDTFLPLVHILWPILVARLGDREVYVVAGTLEVLGCICAGAGAFVRSRVEGIWGRVCQIHEGAEGSVQGKGAVDHTTMLKAPRITSSAAVDVAPKTIPLRSSDSTPSDQALVPLSTRTTSSSANSLRPTTSSATASSEYTPTSTHTLRTAITSFCLKLLANVPVSHEIFWTILTKMLYRPMLKDVEQKRGDGSVRETLEKVNVDAVWLVLERAGVEQDHRKSTGMERPENVARAPEFLAFA